MERQAKLITALRRPKPSDWPLSQTVVCDGPPSRHGRVADGEPGAHVEFELAVHGHVRPDQRVSPR